MEEANSLFQRFLRTFPENEVIFEEGSYGAEMFIVHSGTVRIVKNTEQGGERTIGVLEPGEFFGEMSLIDGSPRAATAIAVGPNTELIVLDKTKFRYMVQQHPEFSLSVMHRLAEIIRGINEQKVSYVD